MDEAFKDFFGVHTVVFAAVCWIGTFLIRRIVETTWPSLKKAASEMAEAATYKTSMACWWNQVILYFVPVVLGATASTLATMYPFPAGIQSVSGRLFFGIVVGFFSGFLFKVVKPIFVRIFGLKETDLPAGSVPPPPAG